MDEIAQVGKIVEKTRVVRSDRQVERKSSLFRWSLATGSGLGTRRALTPSSYWEGMEGMEGIKGSKRPRQDSQDNEAYQGVSANPTSLALAGVRSGRP